MSAVCVCAMCVSLAYECILVPEPLMNLKWFYTPVIFLHPLNKRLVPARIPSYIAFLVYGIRLRLVKGNLAIMA
ncbi:hypothetical protein D3C87_2070920 [compost metagenome]